MTARPAMNRPIDLRSDTVTQPTPEMRRAMAQAEVGDDVYGEDPTVNRLQEKAAEMVGHEAALFVPTGTMGNQIAVKVHTRPGQEVIIEERGHIFNYEMATMAAFSGCLARPVRASRKGHLSWEEIEAHLAPPVYYLTPTGLVALENTHNMAGGTVLPPDQTRRIVSSAHERGLPVHLDGARIFNAAVHLGVPAAQLAGGCDSVMFCLSKGLSAPLGSILAGSRPFIEEARRVRKMMGGGMRQAGVVAAAGLVALETMRERLAQDHENARLLGEGLARMPGFHVDLDSLETNIVVVDLEGASQDLVAALKAEGILVGAIGARRVRFVTHKDVSRAQIERVLEVLGSLDHS